MLADGSPERLSAGMGLTVSRSAATVGTRAAVYSFWIGFPELIVAEAFVRDQPRFGLDTIRSAF
jgi:hypothetical protein